MSGDAQSSIVTKCGVVLDLLARMRRGVTYSEIVAATGFSKSSGHRILAVLQGEGLVRYEPRDKTYALGSRVMGWAQSAWRNMDLQQASQGELEGLHASSELNIALGILHADSVLYLRTMDNLHVRFASKAGDYAPLHCTAIGKTLLAWQPESLRRELLARLSLERHTEFTIIDRGALESHLGDVRAQGYAIADREEVLQVCGLAAPVFGFDGGIVGAVSLWGPISAAPLDALRAQSGDLLKATRRMSEKMGALDGAA